MRLAVIPARGGSKRLPRKNVLPFLGKPIIGYTVEAARASKLFDRVIVSTEDDEIASIAAGFGAEVRERAKELASDTARVVDVCLDLLDREQAQGRAYDVLAVLYATAPLRTAEDIAGTVNLLEPGRCDFALAVTNYDLPPHQALKVGDDNAVAPMWPALINERADVIGKLCVDNGSTYAVSVGAFRRERGFYGPGLRGYLMPRSRSIDIDTPEDFEMAQLMAERMQRGGR
jgi:CMP-N-acetylneuraminic acid synthetase